MNIKLSGLLVFLFVVPLLANAQRRGRSSIDVIKVGDSLEHVYSATNNLFIRQRDTIPPSFSENISIKFWPVVNYYYKDDTVRFIHFSKGLGNDQSFFYEGEMLRKAISFRENGRMRSHFYYTDSENEADQDKLTAMMNKDALLSAKYAVLNTSRDLIRRFKASKQQ